MPTSHTLIAFALVSGGIVLVPGPSNFFILAQGVRHGRRTALGAMVGVSIASALRVLLAAAGLLAVLASSALAYELIRWAGVVYLGYLGVRAYRSRTTPTPVDPMSTSTTRRPAGVTTTPTVSEERESGDRPASVARSVWKGVLVGLGNPKMVLFFVAFFPQFIAPDRGPATGQILVLGTVFWIIGTAWDLGFAFLSGNIGTWLAHRPRLLSQQGRVEGIAYVGLAAWTALRGVEA